jgi:hypothetical protein
VVAVLALVGVAACAVATVYYLAEYPSYPQTRGPAIALSLPPVTAVVLAVVLAGCLWLGMRPPRWLLPDRVGRWFGVAMAILLVGGFLLDSRLVEPGLQRGSHGMVDDLFSGPILVVLPGSVVAAAVGRSFRSGLWACAWAVVLGAPLLIAAWLAEGLHWDQVGRGLVLDGDGPLGVGANLVDAVRWTLLFLALWALPLECVARPPGAAGATTAGTPTCRSRPDGLNRRTSTLQLFVRRTSDTACHLRAIPSTTPPEWHGQPRALRPADLGTLCYRCAAAQMVRMGPLQHEA